MSVGENLKSVLSQIENAERSANRKLGCVRLLAVSKFHSIEEIEDAINAGQLYFGENRVQEAYQKFSVLVKKYPKISLHIIGRLQTNKVKKAVEIASCIESVDRLDLIKEIEKQCEKINKTMDIFFEYHTGEETKTGFTNETDLENAINYIAENNAPHIKIKGFMTMAPFCNDEKIIRSSFKKLKIIQQKMQKKYSQFDFSELSMGMSGDFKIAISEGSTQVRIGTAIFGERDYSK